MTISSHSLRLKTKHCFLLIKNDISRNLIWPTPHIQTLKNLKASHIYETLTSGPQLREDPFLEEGKLSLTHFEVELELPNFFRLDDKDFLRLFSHSLFYM
ncbi:hypothetical protein PGT21_023474 [Puccinia graminis f. sp. tritici]|uniref:Uncharacterized protein n=1 Tax=Puccinia graminis f. sp. tritici TaxID=56615 RepID=A0A5B0MLZ2_PUCGR|nr:hypothetical protein PGT21_023474 [Puccinia graminis f. sp. tritici]